MHRKHPEPQQIKNIPVFLGIGVSILLIVVAVLLQHATAASAAPTDLTVLEIQYPAIAGSKIDSCAACHTASIPNLNSFGYAYKLNGRSAAALVAIQSLDSDGDGISNLQEIKAVSFPGAANLAPQAVASTIAGYPAPSTPTAVVTTVGGYPPPASPTPAATLTSTRTTAPTQTSTATGAATNTPTSGQAASNTPTATRLPSNTPNPTQAPSNTPVSTQVSTNTPISTQVPPTSTQVVPNTPTSTQSASRTPAPTSAVSITPTRRATDERRVTRTPRATETPRSTRVPRPTQVCPTPRGDDDGGLSRLSEADRIRCGHGGGGGGHTFGDLLNDWWNAFIANFKPGK